MKELNEVIKKKENKIKDMQFKNKALVMEAEVQKKEEEMMSKKVSYCTKLLGHIMTFHHR